MVQERRKFLSIRERSLREQDINRVPQRFLTRQERRQRTAVVAQYNQRVQKEAQRLDQRFEQINFGGSVNNFVQEFNKIKAQNPDVANRLKTNPETIKQKLNDRKQLIEKEISKTRKEITNRRKKGRSTKTPKAKLKGLKQGLNELKKGNFIATKDIIKFSAQLAIDASLKEKTLKKQVKLAKFDIERRKRELKEIKVSPDIKPAVIKKAKPAEVKKIVFQEFKAFLTKDRNLVNKALTKQTITPTERIRLGEIIKEDTKKLNERQKTILKNVPKDIGKGLLEVGKEIFLDPVKASFIYGKDLRKRFDKGEDNPLKRDIQKLAQGTVKVGKFVKDNPQQASAIVGLAILSGGKQFGKAFSENPIKTTTKAAAFLFPGTVIKGGVKGAQLGIKGVKNTQQALRLVSIENKVKTARVGLTTSQANKLSSAVGSASKIGNTAKQNQKLRTALNSILKDRKIPVKRGESIPNLVSKVKRSKDIVIATKITKPKVKKEFLKFKGKKVTKISKKGLPAPKAPRKKRDPTKFIQVKGVKAKKITKKQFIEKAKPKKIIIPKKPKKPTKKLTKAQKDKIFKQELAQKGVIKKEGTTFIDLNAVARIEKSTVPVKPIARKTLFANKRASLRFRTQVQVQIQKQKTIIKKTPKTKANKKKLTKTKKDLNKLKNIVKLSRIAGLAAIVKSINGVIKAADTAIKQAEKPIQEPKPITKPIAITKPTVKTKPVQKVAQKPVLKVAQKGKVIPKKVVKTIPRRPKPTKPLKPFKLPKLTFDSKLPAGSKLKYDFRFKQKGKLKTIKLGLPLNKAIKRGFGAVDKTTHASAQLIVSGTTKAKDIMAKDVTRLKAKFRITRSKAKNALLFVEKRKNRIDTTGEKKGLKLSKVLRKKKR